MTMTSAFLHVWLYADMLISLLLAAWKSHVFISVQRANESFLVWFFGLFVVGLSLLGIMYLADVVLAVWQWLTAWRSDAG